LTHISSTVKNVKKEKKELTEVVAQLYAQQHKHTNTKMLQKVAEPRRGRI
jgi:hypothetical protein